MVGWIPPSPFGTKCCPITSGNSRSTEEGGTGEEGTGEGGTGEGATGEGGTGERATGERATGEGATGFVRWELDGFASSLFWAHDDKAKMSKKNHPTTDLLLPIESPFERRRHQILNYLALFRQHLNLAFSRWYSNNLPNSSEFFIACHMGVTLQSSPSRFFRLSSEESHPETEKIPGFRHSIWG